jgi:hypothetical protein
MANPFPFTAGQILTAAQLNGIGEAATSFTPTFSGYTRGNGTSVAYYTRVNKLVYIYVKETLGSTSSVTGTISMTLPVTAARLQSVPFPQCVIEDPGNNLYVGTLYPTSTTAAKIQVNVANSTYVFTNDTNSTTPMTWATNDNFAFGFVYEVA